MYPENSTGVSIHDGFPNPASDISLQPLDLNRLLIHNNVSTFFIRITGDDWQHCGIFHGDIAIIDRSLIARSGDIVVWNKDDNLAISYWSEIPRGAVAWGVVSSIIHQFRGKL